MAGEGRPRPETDPQGLEGSSFTIAGRVTRWEPIARELTIGGRVLTVAASVLLVGHIDAGIPIMASGYQPPDPIDQWVVTRLRVG
jgi:hypothetical protein